MTTDATQATSPRTCTSWNHAVSLRYNDPAPAATAQLAPNSLQRRRFLIPATQRGVLNLGCTPCAKPSRAWSCNCGYVHTVQTTGRVCQTHERLTGTAPTSPISPAEGSPTTPRLDPKFPDPVIYAPPDVIGNLSQAVRARLFVLGPLVRPSACPNFSNNVILKRRTSRSHETRFSSHSLKNSTDFVLFTSFTYRYYLFASGETVS